MTIFGTLIKKARAQKNLTLTQLGGQLDVDSGALSKIENGKKQLNEKLLPILAKIFNLDINYLKEEYYSEKIALILFKNNCSDKTYELINQKLKYLRYTNTKQERINFD